MAHLRDYIYNKCRYNFKYRIDNYNSRLSNIFLIIIKVPYNYL